MTKECVCKQCGAKFKQKVNTKGKFCSMKCWQIYEGKDKSRAPLCKLGYGSHITTKWIK